MAEVWRLTVATARREIRPVTEVFDCRMINQWHTPREPMRGFVARVQALEQQPGVLSVSFGHGFPYGDTPDTTAKGWVVTDNDPALAARLAQALGQEIFAMRLLAVQPRQQSLDDVIDQMLAAAQPGRPVVVADRADNAGGGAPGDSTFILRRLVERRIGNVALGAFFDLGAVHTCREAGVGAELDLRIGGKTGPSSGDPMDLRVTVRAIVPDHRQGGLAGAEASCGPSVWVRRPMGWTWC
jgi:microcystin degradation protein MlrC